MCCLEIRKSASARHLLCRRPFPLRLFFLRLFFLFSLTSVFSAPARAETSRAVGYLLLPAEFYAIEPDSSFIDMRTGSGTVTMHLNTILDDLPGSAKSTLLLFSSSDAETLTVEEIEFHRRGMQVPDEDVIYDDYDVSVSYTIHKKGEVSLILRSFFSEDPADFPRAWLGNEEASLVRRYEQNDWGWEEWSWEAVSWDDSFSEEEDDAPEYAEDDAPDPVEDDEPEYVEDDEPEYVGDDAPDFVEEEGSAPVEDGDPGFVEEEESAPVEGGDPDFVEEEKDPSPVAGGISAPKAAEDSTSGEEGTRDDTVDGTRDPVKGKAPGSGSSTAAKAGSIAADLLEGIPDPDPAQDIPRGILPGLTDPDIAAQAQASQAQASQAQALRSQTRQAAQTQVREAQPHDGQSREAQTQVRETQAHNGQSRGAQTQVREAQPQAGQLQKVQTQTARTQDMQADQGTQNPGQPVRADQNVKALSADKIAAKTAPQTAQDEKRTVSKNSNDITKLQILTAAACLLFVLLGVFRARRSYLRSLRQGERGK